MGSTRKRTADEDVASKSKRGFINNNNRYHPLQTLNDNEKEENMGASTAAAPKVHIPPITILKSTTDDIHKFCKESKVTKYSIRKISIGHKLFCEHKFDYEILMNYLKSNNIEYFSYTPKSNRPYKVVLSGLDKIDPIKVKLDLAKMGLECLDVKAVFRKTGINREVVLYIVYLKKGSINLAELRDKYNSINYIRVKWNYHTKSPNKITQCYNCQMFGHGSSNCNIKTFCAKCAGAHETSTCTSTDVKCANCNGDHKSTDNICPNRSSFVSMRDRYAGPNRRNMPRVVNNHVTNTRNNYNNNYGNNHTSTGNTFANVVRSSPNNSNDLFSLEELKCLTLELIGKLKNCKTKSDQFAVITDLAFKFLP